MKLTNTLTQFEPTLHNNPMSPAILQLIDKDKVTALIFCKFFCCFDNFLYKTNMFQKEFTQATRAIRFPFSDIYLK